MAVMFVSAQIMHCKVLCNNGQGYSLPLSYMLPMLLMEENMLRIN